MKLYHVKPQTLEHVEIIIFSDKQTYDTSLESYWLGDQWFWLSTWSYILIWSYTISNLKILNLKRLEKLQINEHKIHYWKATDLEIIDCEYQQDLTYSCEKILLKPQTLNHVEIIKVSDKPTYEASLESYWLGDQRFWLSTWSDILIWSYTISNLNSLNM